MKGRRVPHVLVVTLLAVWQAAMLIVCAPAARATPVVAPSACCHAPAEPTDEAPPPTTCLHCTNGTGHFVDPATPGPPPMPHAMIDRLPPETAATAENIVVKLSEDWRLYRPPDPTLLALRCSLVR